MSSFTKNTAKTATSESYGSTSLKYERSPQAVRRATSSVNKSPSSPSGTARPQQSNYSPQSTPTSKTANRKSTTQAPSNDQNMEQKGSVSRPTSRPGSPVSRRAIQFNSSHAYNVSIQATHQTTQPAPNKTGNPPSPTQIRRIIDDPYAFMAAEADSLDAQVDAVQDPIQPLSPESIARVTRETVASRARSRKKGGHHSPHVYLRRRSFSPTHLLHKRSSSGVSDDEMDTADETLQLMQGDTDIIEAEENARHKLAAALAVSSVPDPTDQLKVSPPVTSGRDRTALSQQADPALDKYADRSSRLAGKKAVVADEYSNEDADDDDSSYSAHRRTAHEDSDADYADEQSEGSDSCVQVQMRLRMGSQGQGSPQTVQWSIDERSGSSMGNRRSRSRSRSRSRTQSPRQNFKASISSSPSSTRKPAQSADSSTAWWDQQDSTHDLSLLINGHGESGLDAMPTNLFKFTHSKPSVTYQEDSIQYGNDSMTISSRRKVHSEAFEDPPMIIDAGRKQKAPARNLQSGPSPDEVAIMMVPESPKSKRRSMDALNNTGKTSHAAMLKESENSRRIGSSGPTHNDRDQLTQLNSPSSDGRFKKAKDRTLHVETSPSSNYEPRSVLDAEASIATPGNINLPLPASPVNSDGPVAAREAQWRARERAFSLLVQQLTTRATNAEHARDALRADMLVSTTAHKAALDTATLELQKLQDEMEAERATSARWRRQSRALAHALDVARAERELVEAKLRTSRYASDSRDRRFERHGAARNTETPSPRAICIDTSLATRSPRQTRKSNNKYDEEDVGDSIYRVEIASSSPSRYLRESAI